MTQHFTARDLDVLQMKARPKGTLPPLTEGRDPELLRGWLTRAFRPEEGWSFDTFERPTTAPNDGCSVTFRNGRETVTYRFRHQADLMGPKLRAMVLSVAQGELDMQHLTASEIEDVWAAMCKLGSVLTHFDERDETRKWIEQTLTATIPLIGHSLVPDDRWNALMAIRAQGEFTKPDALALQNAHRNDDGTWLRRPIRFIDRHTGEQYLRAGETATYLRYVLGAEPLSHVTLRGRLAEIEVEAVYHQDRRPPHPKAWLYRLTDELIEFTGASEGRV